jgi:hypothetical protein
VPGLHHFKPPADDPPGFRVAADGSVRNGSPNDPYLWSLGYDPHADITLPTGISSDALRPFRDGSNPFELLDQRRVNTDPVPSFDGGSLPSHAASLLFPRMTEPRFAWTNLVDDGGEIDTGPDDLLPGFRVEPSTDDPPSSRIWTGLMDDSGELNTGPDGPLPGSASNHRRTSHRLLALPATIQWATSTSPPSDTILFPTSRHAAMPVPLAEFIQAASTQRPICCPIQYTSWRTGEILCKRHSIRSHGFIASTGKVRMAVQPCSMVPDPPMGRRPPSAMRSIHGTSCPRRLEADPYGHRQVPDTTADRLFGPIRPLGSRLSHRELRRVRQIHLRSSRQITPRGWQVPQQQVLPPRSSWMSLCRLIPKLPRSSKPGKEL